jgi:magnesium transporter
MLTTYGREEGQSDQLWFDLVNPSKEEILRAEKATGLKLPTREKLSEIEASSRVSDIGGVLSLNMPFVASAQAIDDAPSPVGFVLSEKVLVTIRFAELRSFDAVKASLKEGKNLETSAEVFASITSEMVDAISDLLEKIGGELDALSRKIFPTPKGRHGHKMKSNAVLRAILVDVGHTGERLSHIRSCLLGLQRIIPYSIAKERPWISTAVVQDLKEGQMDLASLADFETQLYGKVQFLLDAVLGFITTKQNDIFQVLTVVSVAGIPPTLIASIYGMNFKNMPELNWSWGYPYALALIALSTILPLLWFKWRGWF